MTDTSDRCACRGDVPCLLHYAELTIFQRNVVRARLGIDPGNTRHGVLTS